jgi:predicted PurR-regulated permease PerM
VRIHRPFRTGLLGGLGVLLALAIGGAVTQLATILTYVGAALFLALGLDPIISTLQRRGVPRWLSILFVLVGGSALVAALLLVIVPAIAQQTAKLINGIVTYSQGITWQQFLRQVQAAIGLPLDLKMLLDQATTYVQQHVGTITGGVLQVGLGIIGGVAGAAIVIILTIYFTASLDTFKRGLYLLVPMTRRERFAHIAEQIFQSVGRFVIGQVTLALVNGLLSFVFLTVVGAQLPAVFAFIAFLGSLIPLVGTISGAILIVLGQVVLAGPSNVAGLPVWLVVAIYYLIYMQVEAYVLSPHIMNRAVKVPGVVVVIAALIGGTLLGILGALVAIPVAAAVQLILQQVVVPRQAEL